jgi:hypothetical protein
MLQRLEALANGETEPRRVVTGKERADKESNC